MVNFGDNSVLIGGVAALAVAGLVAGAISLSTESYANNDAKFTVKYPKNQVMNPHAAQPLQQSVREGFMVPTPSKKQTLLGVNLAGGLTGPKANAFLGGLPNELSYGVSAPSPSTGLLHANLNASNPAVASVWRTVI